MLIYAFIHLIQTLIGFKFTELGNIGLIHENIPTENTFIHNSDTRLLADKIKHHHFLFNELYLKEGKDLDNATRERMLHTMHDLEAIYPINKNKYASVWDLYSSFKGKGIVMTTGKFHFKYALHSINVLRRLNCTLPIQILYNGNIDLTEGMIKTLGRIKNVMMIDISSYVPLSYRNLLRGWGMKPFTMLVSGFEEFIYVDADVLFFKNPEILYEFQAYRDTGTLYFRDRTISSGDSGMLDYFKYMVPNPSDYAKNERVWRGQSIHECDSGVIVMNKRRGGMFVLLLATILNMDPFKHEMYKVVHGDKESYWMASEALQLPYSWAPGAGGAVGFPNPHAVGSICGHLYHVDEHLAPLWFNGGITMNKHTKIGSNITINISHFAFDSNFENVVWRWENDSHPYCLKPAFPKKETGRLSEDFLRIRQMMIYEWLLLDLPEL